MMPEFSANVDITILDNFTSGASYLDDLGNEGLPVGLLIRRWLFHGYGMRRVVDERQSVVIKRCISIKIYGNVLVFPF